MTNKFLLITGRTLQQGIAMEAEGKFSPKYMDNVAVAEMHPDDISKLSLNGKCLVESEFGSVVVKVRASKEVTPGTIFIPMGPWANAIVDPRTESTGMPNLKGTYVAVKPTDKDITSLEEILSRYTKKKVIYKGVDLKVEDGEKKVIEDVVCTFCAELCDYLRVEVSGNRILRNIGGCALSNAKYQNYYKHRILKPLIRKNDDFVEVSYDEAIEEAAKILANSKYPLLFGWSDTSTQAIELGIYLTEILGGIMDNTSVICHGPTALGAQEVGTARATLGVIRHLADLIIIWGSNCLHAHPNHLVRWVFSKGKDRSGRKDRKIVVVDVRETATAKQADKFIHIEPGRDLEFITALRMAVRDIEIEAESVAGVSKEEILELADMMRTAKYGVIFVGMGVTMTGAKFRNIQEVIKLAHDLNEWTRFTVIPMRGHYNVTGANAATLWNTGYPYGVHYQTDFPKMIVGVTTTTEPLINEEVDAALVVASDPVAHLPNKAVKHLCNIPLIVVDPKWSLTASVADVVIPSKMIGIEDDGTAYRMDGVAIHVKRVVDPPDGLLSDVEILKRLVNRILELRGLM